MGTWSIGSFENDNALDWLQSLEVEGPVLVHASLLVVASAAEDDYLDADEASDALAAAELVAAARHQTFDRIPDATAMWCKRNDSAIAGLAGTAAAAVRRVLTSSELAELWSESEDDARWREHVQELLQRLSR